MTGKYTRRDLLARSACSLALAGASTLAVPRFARAADEITVVEWGEPYIGAMKAVAAQQDTVDVNWVLHSGGAAAILPKIRATWPEPQYDLVAAWSPVFQAMNKEGWCEAFTAADVPNIAEIPESLIHKDEQGRFLTIPRTMSAIHWWYREDTCPIEIKTLDDLLDPRMKGKVLFPDPVLNTNLQIITLALHRGGDERNLEPGWEFVKELAKSGNIGRVAHADVDTLNSISTGETCVTFSGAPNAVKLNENFPIVSLTKVGRETGFVTSLYNEGWCILKGGNTKAAFDFANHTISAKSNEDFNSAGGGIPTNITSERAARLDHLAFTDEELDRHAFIPDWAYISEQVDGWMKRWEQEVVPLL